MKLSGGILRNHIDSTIYDDSLYGFSRLLEKEAKRKIELELVGGHSEVKLDYVGSIVANNLKGEINSYIQTLSKM